MRVLKARSFKHEPDLDGVYFFGGDLHRHPLTTDETVQSRSEDFGYYSCPCTCGVRFDEWHKLSEHVVLLNNDMIAARVREKVSIAMSIYVTTGKKRIRI